MTIVTVTYRYKVDGNVKEARQILANVAHTTSTSGGGSNNWFTAEITGRPIVKLSKT